GVLLGSVSHPPPRLVGDVRRKTSICGLERRLDQAAKPEFRRLEPVVQGRKVWIRWRAWGPRRLASEEGIQPIRDPLPSPSEERVVGLHLEQVVVERDALRQEGFVADLLTQFIEVGGRRLRAQLPVRLATDE